MLKETKILLSMGKVAFYVNREIVYPALCTCGLSERGRERGRTSGGQIRKFNIVYCR